MPVLDFFKLDGKIALVTGANQRLGKAIAIALAEAGAGIVSMSRSPESAEAADYIKGLGRCYHTIKLDFRTATVPELEAAVQQAVVLAGRLDILVNNAGIILRAPAMDFTEAD